MGAGGLIRREAEEGQPIFSAQIDTGQLIGAFSSPWPAVEFVHVEPEPEEIEKKLSAGLVGGFAAVVEVGAQNAVDGFGSTAGADDAFEQVEQILRQGVGDGVIGDEFGDPLTGFGKRLGKLALSAVENGMFQAPQAGDFGLKEGGPGGVGEVPGGAGLPVGQGLRQAVEEGQPVGGLGQQFFGQALNAGVVELLQGGQGFIQQPLVDGNVADFAAAQVDEFNGISQAVLPETQAFGLLEQGFAALGQIGPLGKDGV